MKKIIVIRLILLLTSIINYGQQDSQYTQYMYNTININPAYAGSRDVTSIFVMHRTQWVGLDGAPVTNMASINTPIGNSNLGLGGSIINNRIGPSNENTFSVDLSYRIPISEKYKLSFGLKTTANLLTIDFNKLNIYDQNDYVFFTNIDGKFSFNIGAGLYLYSDNSYIGLSAPNLLETEYFDKYSGVEDRTHITKEKIHLYLIGGHVFDLNSNLKFKPSLLTKYVQGAPLQVDLSANFLINDKFVAGIAYRWSAAISAMLGVQVSKSWLIGYGYDLETTRLSNFNSGSHEVFLRFEIINRKTSCYSSFF
jgi:type IX secretion system PorP/SprF family membrane protein